MIPYTANIQHMQGDAWEVSFKLATDLTGHACRMVLTSGLITKTFLTSDGSMTLSYSADETLTVDGVTETGITTLTPVLSLVDSAVLPAGVYDYELEDLSGMTFIRGKCTVIGEVSK